MILADANLLIYAVDETATHHQRARDWLEEALAGPETVAFSWTVLLAVLRLTTSHSVFRQPLEVDEALDLVDGWLQQPSATVVAPTPRHAEVLRDLLEPVGTAGNLTTDAHLAALAIEHRATLCTADADFGRFPGLDTHNPVA